jgi:hypothetical protein
LREIVGEVDYLKSKKYCPREGIEQETNDTKIIIVDFVLHKRTTETIYGGQISERLSVLISFLLKTIDTG